MYDFFISSVHFILFNRKPNSTIEQQKCEGHDKLDRLLVSNVEVNFQISQRNKKLPLDLVFSILGYINQKS